jgi:hypothetical protein
LKQKRGPSDTVFGGLCEVFRLLELRGEYASFIVDLESELRARSKIVLKEFFQLIFRITETKRPKSMPISSPVET